MIDQKSVCLSTCTYISFANFMIGDDTPAPRAIDFEAPGVPIPISQCSIFWLVHTFGSVDPIILIHNLLDHHYIRPGSHDHIKKSHPLGRAKHSRPTLSWSPMDPTRRRPKTFWPPSTKLLRPSIPLLRPRRGPKRPPRRNNSRRRSSYSRLRGAALRRPLP